MVQETVEEERGKEERCNKEGKMVTLGRVMTRGEHSDIESCGGYAEKKTRFDNWLREDFLEDVGVFAPLYSVFEIK